MMRRFAGKRVIVTGASGGIGAATVRQFVVEGARVALLARNRARLEAVADHMGGVDTLVVPADVTDSQAVGLAIERIATYFGGIDILVNNAGYHARGVFEERRFDELTRMIDVNLRAPAVLSRLVLPYLRRAGGGAIVNVSSLAGRVPSANTATYCASKSGLRAFSLALAEELEGSGITVSVISPGLVDTEFFAGQLERISALAFSQPVSTADEVAKTVLACAHDGRSERSVPALAGYMCFLGSLFPGGKRLLRPWLERRGQRKKMRFIHRKRAEGWLG